MAFGWRLAPVLVLLTACGESPVAVCAGNHQGTFSGSDVGTLTATLDQKGKANVTMTGEASGTFSSNGNVEDDGTVSASGLVVINGDLDLETCESSGTWDQTQLGLTGTWSMSLQ